MCTKTQSQHSGPAVHCWGNLSVLLLRRWLSASIPQELKAQRACSSTCGPTDCMQKVTSWTYLPSHIRVYLLHIYIMQLSPSAPACKSLTASVSIKSRQAKGPVLFAGKLLVLVFWTWTGNSPKNWFTKSLGSCSADMARYSFINSVCIGLMV